MGKITLSNNGTAPPAPSGYLSTGIITGLDLQGTVGDATFSVGAGEFYTQDFSDPAQIVSNRVVVSPTDFVGLTITNALTDIVTYVFLLTAPGGGPALLQRTTPPNVDDISIGLVYLGNLSHDDGTGLLTFDATNLGWVAYGRTTETNRAELTRGTVRESGVMLDFNGNGLTPTITAGVISRLGAGRLLNPADPDRVPVLAHPYGAGIGPTFRTYSDGAGGLTVEPETAIAPANYDDGSGVLATGNVNRYYRHRFFVFPIVGPGGQVVFHQFDGTDYQTLEDAVNAAPLTDYPFLSEAATIGTLHIQGSSVDPWADLLSGSAVLSSPPTIEMLYR